MTDTTLNIRQYLLNHIPTLQDKLQRQSFWAHLFGTFDTVPTTCFNHVLKLRQEKDNAIPQGKLEEAYEKLNKQLATIHQNPPTSVLVDNFAHVISGAVESELENVRKIDADPVRVRHLQWGLVIEDFLLGLEFDLQLLDEVEMKDWNLTILTNALKLATFLYNIFDVDLRDLYASYTSPEGQFVGASALGTRIKQTLDSIREIKESLERKVSRSNLPGSKELSSRTTMAAIRLDYKVSSATLTELLVRNVLDQHHEEIRQRLQGKTSAEMQTTCKEIADSIIGPALAVFINPIKKRPQFQSSWLPRVITIVIDTSSGLAFTGGTQPICEKFILFRDFTGKINKYRLGSPSPSKFSWILDTRSKFYSDLVTPMTDMYKTTGFPELSSMYKQLVLEKKFDQQTLDTLKRLHEESQARGSKQPSSSKPISDSTTKSQVNQPSKVVSKEHQKDSSSKQQILNPTITLPVTSPQSPQAKSKNQQKASSKPLPNPSPPSKTLPKGQKPAPAAYPPDKILANESILELILPSLTPSPSTTTTPSPESPNNNNTICWALNGETLNFVPPCLRCQSLYPTWTFWGIPSTKEEQIDHFDRGMREPSSRTKYSAGDFACAESVAGAKVYAARCGSVGIFCL